MPGGAESLYDCFANIPLQTFIGYSVVMYTKLAFKELKDKETKQNREEEVISRLRNILFEHSDTYQTFPIQIYSLLVLAERLSAVKLTPKLEIQCQEYYKDYTKENKIFQEILRIFDDIHDSNLTVLEKEAKACLLAIDNMIMTMYKSKDEGIIERTFEKYGKKSEEKKEPFDKKKQKWKVILYDIGSHLIEQVNKAKKKYKSKFCSLTMKILRQNHHEVTKYIYMIR